MVPVRLGSSRTSNEGGTIRSSALAVFMARHRVFNGRLRPLQYRAR
jgi:hypothetical protein